MAIATNTFTTYDDKRKREEFSNIISDISPEETPFTTMIGKRKVVSTHPEWSNDSLAPPNPANAVPQGDEYTYGAVTATVRNGTYTQIMRKEWIVSETDEVVDKAGQQSELNRQRVKKGKELKKDREAVMLLNQGSLAGNQATAPLMAGLPAWLKTADNRGTGGADGGFNTGSQLVVAATNGTQRDFTKTIMDDVFQKSYNAGGEGRVLMVSPYVKTRFSTFMSDPSVAPQRTSTQRGQATIIGAADAYQGDFGLYDVVPNRIMGTNAALARNAYVLDPDFLAIGTLRDIREDTPARTGDATKKVLLWEGTLLVDNEGAIGIAADLFGLTAST